MVDSEVEAPLWRGVDVTFVEGTVVASGDFGVGMQATWDAFQ